MALIGPWRRFLAPVSRAAALTRATGAFGTFEALCSLPTLREDLVEFCLLFRGQLGPDSVPECLRLGTNLWNNGSPQASDVFLTLPEVGFDFAALFRIQFEIPLGLAEKFHPLPKGIGNIAPKLVQIPGPHPIP